MKKIYAFLFVLLICLSFFGTVSAGPEDVTILPVSKWNYKNVDGWGFYAKNGEYSWFAFVLNNPTNSDYSVTLPEEVNVANRTNHKIVNTAYKAMNYGNNNFLYEGFPKIYFANSFTLPAKSTYAVFMDVTDLSEYTSQWDTDVFFSVQISSEKQTASIDINKGILAYDALNNTPEKLTIAEINVPELTVLHFCRDYSESTGKINFVYTLKNNSTTKIPVEIATTLAVEGLENSVAIRHMNCVSGNGSSCISRIQNGKITLNAGETAAIRGEVSLTEAPSNADYYVRTSLRYDFNGKKLIPLYVGSAISTCYTTTQEPEPVTTATPEPATTPELIVEALTSTGICRNHDAGSNKVSFTYGLSNNSTEAIPVELATTLAIEGQQRTAAIRYLNCMINGTSCISRIKNGYLTLNPEETVTLKGESTLSQIPESEEFYVRTSLRYNHAGKNLIPLFIGKTTDTCSEQHALSIENNNISSNDGPVAISFELINDSENETEIIPGPISLSGTEITDYLGSAVTGSADRDNFSQNSILFSNGEVMVLPPNSVTEITVIFDKDPSIKDIARENIVWNFSADGKTDMITLNVGIDSALEEDMDEGETTKGISAEIQIATEEPAMTIYRFGQEPNDNSSVNGKKFFNP